MLKRIIVLTLLLGSVLLAGCGQKGPLYLPAPSETPVEVKSETPVEVKNEAAIEKETSVEKNNVEEKK